MVGILVDKLSAAANFANEGELPEWNSVLRTPVRSTKKWCPRNTNLQRRKTNERTYA